MKCFCTSTSNPKETVVSYFIKEERLLIIDEILQVNKNQNFIKAINTLGGRPLIQRKPDSMQLIQFFLAKRCNEI